MIKVAHCAQCRIVRTERRSPVTAEANPRPSLALFPPITIKTMKPPRTRVAHCFFCGPDNSGERRKRGSDCATFAVNLCPALAESVNRLGSINQSGE